MRYFEDFKAGDIIELGSRTLSEDEIIDFARQYDPQPFHIDKEKARDSMFGTLVASGWHTAATYMRLLVDGVLLDSSAQGSPGLDNVRWLRPVHPGDTLTGRVNVLETRVLGSRPQTGVVRSQSEMLNQHGEIVMRMEGSTFYGMRPVVNPES